MARQIDTSRTDEIARVAYAIWEGEGRPDGRDHEHWTKAQRLLEEGRAYTEFPAAAAGVGAVRQAESRMHRSPPPMSRRGRRIGPARRKSRRRITPSSVRRVAS